MSPSEFLHGPITETYLQDAVIPLFASSKKKRNEDDQDGNCPTTGGTSDQCRKKEKPSKKKPAKKPSKKPGKKKR